MHTNLNDHNLKRTERKKSCLHFFIVCTFEGHTYGFARFCRSAFFVPHLWYWRQFYEHSQNESILDNRCVVLATFNERLINRETNTHTHTPIHTPPVYKILSRHCLRHTVLEN